MRTYAYTCGISNLPINDGTPVRYILLADHPFDNNYQMYTFPIQAKYDDYGSVREIKKSYLSELMWSFLNKESIPKPKGEIEFHDVEVRPNMDQHEWLVALLSGRVSILHSEKELKIHPVIVREDIWQKLCKIGTLNLLKIKVKNFWNQSAELRKYDSQDNIIYNSLSSDIIIGGHLDVLNSRWVNYLQMGLPSKNVTEVLDSVAECIHIKNMMRRLRLTWRVSGYTDHFSRDWSLYKSYIEGLKQIVEKELAAG